MSKKWKIWAEGFATSGEYGNHTLMGEADGETFEEACANLAKTDDFFAKSFDAAQLTYWACRLFPTAEEAAKSFG
jgi:hypothetical protein